MKLVPVIRLVQVQKRYARNLNAANIQSVFLFDSQILMLMEKGGTVFTLYEDFGCEQHEVE
jgi:hypothetical protein